MICGHCVVPRGKGIELNRVLFIELSATLRHAAKKIMETHGYQVDDVASFAAGLAKIHETEKDFPYDAVALGWPSKTDHAADELFATLQEPPYRSLNVIVLAHETDSGKLSWVTGRSNTAMILWENYIEIVDVLVSKPKVRSSAAGLESMLSHENTAMRVLFVDDSPTVRVTYRRLLTDNGYVADTASCVEEGMEKASTPPGFKQSLACSKNSRVKKRFRLAFKGSWTVWMITS